MVEPVECQLHKMIHENSSSEAGVKCEGSSVLVLSKITPEIIVKFVAGVTMYCAHKGNRCKNIASWIIKSLVSFSESAFKDGTQVITNATLHIKDPRDSWTNGWYDLRENLLTIRVLPRKWATEYICKTGKEIQKHTVKDKVIFTARIVSILTGGWGQLIPGLDQVLEWIPSQLEKLYQLNNLPKERLVSSLLQNAENELAQTHPILFFLSELLQYLKSNIGDDREAGMQTGLEEIDYSKDIFTSEDKENLTRILKWYWLDHLKSDFNYKSCAHKFVSYNVKTQDGGCSLCKTRQKCRFHCTSCRSTFCRTCFNWDKDWETCPDYHSLEYTSFFFPKKCERCNTRISGRGFEDKECGIYLHVGCGPFKLQLKIKDNKEHLSCMCGKSLKAMKERNLEDCNMCFIRCQTDILCSKCDIKICKKCSKRSFDTLKSM